MYGGDIFLFSVYSIVIVAGFIALATNIARNSASRDKVKLWLVTFLLFALAYFALGGFLAYIIFIVAFFASLVKLILNLSAYGSIGIFWFLTFLLFPPFGSLLFLILPVPGKETKTIK